MQIHSFDYRYSVLTSIYSVIIFSDQGNFYFIKNGNTGKILLDLILYILDGG